MLSTTHKARPIPAPAFLGGAERPRSHTRVFNALRPVHEITAHSRVEGALAFGDSGAFDLSWLEAHYADLRTSLAYRKLRGETLNARESLLLHVLNEVTRLVMKRPDPIPADVMEAAEEALRRLPPAHGPR